MQTLYQISRLKPRLPAEREEGGEAPHCEFHISHVFIWRREN